MRPRHVWRVTGTWPPFGDIEEGWPPGCTVRHYLTERAARHRAALWLKGAEFPGVEPETGAPDSYIIPPALTAVVEKSNRVTWPDAAEGISP